MESFGLVTHWILPKALHTRNKSSNARVTKQTQPTRAEGVVRGEGHRYDLRSRGHVVNPQIECTSRSRSKEGRVSSKSSQTRSGQSGRGRTTSKDASTKVKPSSHRVKSRARKSKNSRRSRVSLALSIRNRARSTSPSPYRIDSSVATETVKNLKQRIQSIPIQNRNMPRTNDIGLLGFELKTRLAMTSPVLVETVQRGGKVKVKTRRVNKRFIPLWEISTQQDPTLICQVQVQRPMSIN